MLTCIPKAKLSNLASRKLLAHYGSIQNTKPDDFGIRPADPLSIAEDKARLDILPDMSSAHEAYTLLKQIEEFNESHTEYQNQPPKEKKPYRDYIVRVKELLQLRSEDYPAKLLEVIDIQVTQFIQTICRKVKELPQEIKEWAAKWVFFYLGQSRYTTSFEPGQLDESVGGFSPSPRSNSTAALIQLYWDKPEPELAKKLIALMSDATQIIRFKAIKTLPTFFTPDPDLYWQTLQQRIVAEQDSYCLHELLKAMYYSDVMDKQSSKVESLLLIFDKKIKGLKINRELRKLYVMIILDLLFNQESTLAGELIRENYSNKSFSQELVWRSFEMIDLLQKEKLSKHPKFTEKGLYELIIDQVIAQFSIAGKLLINDPAIKDPLQVIDTCIQQFYFKVEKLNMESPNKALEYKRTYLGKIKPVLAVIIQQSKNFNQGYMVAHSGYYLMQLLNFLLPVDPEYILKVAADTVSFAAKSSFTYDQSTMKETMKLAEHILADFKIIIKEQENFNALLAILDQFANSGWFEALELIWMLREIF
jgi:hypothetical protein